MATRVHFWVTDSESYEPNELIRRMISLQWITAITDEACNHRWSTQSQMNTRLATSIQNRNTLELLFAENFGSGLALTICAVVTAKHVQPTCQDSSNGVLMLAHLFENEYQGYCYWRHPAVAPRTTAWLSLQEALHTYCDTVSKTRADPMDQRLRRYSSHFFYPAFDDDLKVKERAQNSMVHPEDQDECNDSDAPGELHFEAQ